MECYNSPKITGPSSGETTDPDKPPVDPEDPTPPENNGGGYIEVNGNTLTYHKGETTFEDLKEQGYLVEIEPHSHNVGTHDRCGTTVEPLIKQQWFVKMDEMAKAAIKTLEDGDLKFVPERFDKTYLSLAGEHP